MSLPTQSDVHVNRPLTNISVAMIQDENNFVADKVFPIVPVAKQSDTFFLYDNAYWNADEMQLRAPNTESVGNGYVVSTEPYFAPVYAFHKDIPDQVRANADVPINIDREATLYVTLKALIKRERLFAAQFMAPSVWTRDYTGVSSGVGSNEVLQWSDVASTPIEDVWDAKEEVLQRTGYEPNTLVLGYSTYKNLINHPAFIDRVKYGNYTGPAMIDTADMAALFKVDRVLIMKGIYNAAPEGATKNHQFIAGKGALLTYAAPSPSLMSPSGGYTFSWTGLIGSSPQGYRIKRFYMEQIESTRVEIEMAFVMVKIAADVGAYWHTLVP